MKKKILIIGFGSIGMRHACNAVKIGLEPYVLTQHPQVVRGVTCVRTVRDVKACGPFSHAIICSPTGKHLDDVKRIAACGVKRFLIEKPLEKNLKRAQQLATFIKQKKLQAYVAYNMRYLECFKTIRAFIAKNKRSIRTVEIIAGKYLPNWRKGKDYRKSYSASKKKGGGVHLDLSHEVDYLIWLLGMPVNKSVALGMMPSLAIDSVGIMFGVYQYESCIASVELDYLQKPPRRGVRIACENGKRLHCDLIKNTIEITGAQKKKNVCDMKATYIQEMKDFLSAVPKKTVLSSIEESINVLKLIQKT